MCVQERSSKISLLAKLEQVFKKSTHQERTLSIIENPEIMAKLKNKINALPDKLRRMNNRWSNYENEQKLILSNLNEEINKKRVST